VAFLSLGDTMTTATLVGEITSPDLNVPTTVAWSGENLYAVNARFGTPATPDTEYWITPLPLEPADVSASASPNG
jgi:hypothetical protein